MNDDIMRDNFNCLIPPSYASSSCAEAKRRQLKIEDDTKRFIADGRKIERLLSFCDKTSKDRADKRSQKCKKISARFGESATEQVALKRAQAIRDGYVMAKCFCEYVGCSIDYFYKRKDKLNNIIRIRGAYLIHKSEIPTLKELFSQSTRGRK